MSKIEKYKEIKRDLACISNIVKDMEEELSSCTFLRVDQSNPLRHPLTFSIWFDSRTNDLTTKGMLGPYLARAIEEKLPALLHLAVELAREEEQAARADAADEALCFLLELNGKEEMPVKR